MSKGYLYRKQSETPTVPCPCGFSTRILQYTDTPVANIHVTDIVDSVKHYHKACTEFYYILEGAGKMELGDDLVDLEPGVTIQIDPGTPHRAYGSVKCLIVGIPAWKHDDEFFMTETPEPALTAQSTEG